jgi:hypothetical protein
VLFLDEFPLGHQFLQMQSSLHSSIDDYRVVNMIDIIKLQHFLKKKKPKKILFDGNITCGMEPEHSSWNLDSISGTGQDFERNKIYSSLFCILN